MYVSGTLVIQSRTDRPSQSNGARHFLCVLALTTTVWLPLRTLHVSAATTVVSRATAPRSSPASVSPGPRAAASRCPDGPTHICSSQTTARVTWWRNPEVLAFCGLGLSLFGLVLSLLAVLWAKRHDNEMKAQTQAMASQVHTLKEVANSLPTHAVATFPHHLTYIIELIESCSRDDTFRILADCADYGSFFHPVLHRRMIKALVAAYDKGVDVQIVVGGPTRHFTQSSVLFGKNFSDVFGASHFVEDYRVYIDHLRAERVSDEAFKNWIDARKRPGFERKAFLGWLAQNCPTRKTMRDSPLPEPPMTISLSSLKRLLDRCSEVINGGKPFRRKEGRAFVLMLYCREAYFEEWLGARLSRKVERRPEYPERIFFWLKNKNRAAFMIVGVDEETRGSMMTTEDFNLTNVFSGLFEKTLGDACD